MEHFERKKMPYFPVYIIYLYPEGWVYHGMTQIPEGITASTQVK